MFLSYQQSVALSGLLWLEISLQRDIYLSCDLGIPEYLVLVRASERLHGCPIKKISKRTFLDKKRVDEICNTLENTMAIYRTRDHDGDRRAFSVVATKLGHKKIEVADECIKMRLGSIFGDSSKEIASHIFDIISTLIESDHFNKNFSFVSSLFTMNTQIRDVFANRELTYLQGVIVVYIASCTQAVLVSNISKHFGLPKSSIIPSLLFLEAEGYLSYVSVGDNNEDLQIVLTEIGLEESRTLAENFSNVPLFFSDSFFQVMPSFAEVVQLGRI